MTEGELVQAALQQLLNGISIGSIYALVALGYTLVYGVLRLINFAHCDTMMVGALVGYMCSKFGMGFIPSILIAMIACMILGILIEKLAYKPLRNSPSIMMLIAAIGVSLILQYSAMLFFGAEPRAFPPSMTGGVMEFGGVILSKSRLWVVLLAITVMILLYIIVGFTKMGKAMRALASDKQAAQLVGVNVDNTISVTFALGAALAGVAGVMLGSIFTVSPLMGTGIGVKTFAAAVLGGIGSIPGAMLGGLILGLTETLIASIFGGAFKDALAFVVLIAVLLIKPSGILGKRNMRD